MNLVLVILISFSIFMWFLLPTLWGAPYIPSALTDCRRMLQLVNPQPNQTLVDLGAGDGRIIILGSLLYGAKCEGVEIDPIRCNFVDLLISVFRLRNKA
ncbi:MAG: hypothetical protein AAFQ14_08190, partial [Cyanobacteria bacterium J06621_12]